MTDRSAADVAMNEPVGKVGGVPVYRWGQAPAHLRTQTQLGEARLKLTEGQTVVAYCRSRKYGDIALYDPESAVKMRPLPSATKAKMAKRRTCPKCNQVRQHVVHGTQCTVCEHKAYQAQQRRAARTCWDCREVSERPLPPAHHRCARCRREQLTALRAKAVAWVEDVTVCAGDGCTARVVTKKAARATQKGQGGAERGWWMRSPDWARRCPPCAVAEEQRQAVERAEYERQAQARREAAERRDAERREAEQRRAEERERWAAAALLDPDVVVLDTETTGLHPTARIVEIAVLSSAGDVLLDTLIDPGEPIPAQASKIHRITNADVAGAPTFADVLPQLVRLLEGRRCLIYNDAYDMNRLRHELTLHHLARAAGESSGPTAEHRELVAAWYGSMDVTGPVADARKQGAVWLDSLTVEDVMVPYSDWVGEWSGYHGNNRWQPLDGGHRAAGDCRAVLDCLRAMGHNAEVPGSRSSTDPAPVSTQT
ncbi:exonuclease domain-containing protein [Streptomyces sp. NPDC056987]|uniref:exonuclease domain-containing protein n=1 Tax=Streptomyces sp. NPDC056987 TaxID=3345988 RepID=UPI0036432F91